MFHHIIFLFPFIGVTLFTSILNGQTNIHSILTNDKATNEHIVTIDDLKALTTSPHIEAANLVCHSNKVASTKQIISHTKNPITLKNYISNPFEKFYTSSDDTLCNLDLILVDDKKVTIELNLSKQHNLSVHLEEIYQIDLNRDGVFDWVLEFSTIRDKDGQTSCGEVIKEYYGHLVAFITQKVDTTNSHTVKTYPMFYLPIKNDDESRCEISVQFSDKNCDGFLDAIHSWRCKNIDQSTINLCPNDDKEDQDLEEELEVDVSCETEIERIKSNAQDTALKLEGEHEEQMIQNQKYLRQKQQVFAYITSDFTKHLDNIVNLSKKSNSEYSVLWQSNVKANELYKCMASNLDAMQEGGDVISDINTKDYTEFNYEILLFKSFLNPLGTVQVRKEFNSDIKKQKASLASHHTANSLSWVEIKGGSFVVGKRKKKPLTHSSYTVKLAPFSMLKTEV